MTAFPVFKRLTIHDYGMYPGTANAPGLDMALQPGLTLVLGANGLGKTTLVNILYRMCAGPTDIPTLAAGGELGGRSLSTRRLGRSEQRLFADRVVDHAASATATLEMDLDETNVSVTRSLQTLGIEEFAVDGTRQDADESTFQGVVTDAAGISAFGDWILLLRHITFYFEDRRALVWDATAQRQIFRMLFLPTKTSDRWVSLERGILSLDSRMRNLQATLAKEERAYLKARAAAGSEAQVRKELEKLETEQEPAEAKVEAMENDIAGLDARQAVARLATLRAELAHESAYRDLERRQLLAIDSVFPTQDATARYLLSKLFAEGRCLTCGSDAPDAANAIARRIQADSCVVCGHQLGEREQSPSFSARALARAEAKVEKAEAEVAGAREERRKAEAACAAAAAALQVARTEVAERRARIETLVARLPPDEAELHGTRSALATFRAQVEEMRAGLTAQRREFRRFIEGVTRSVAARSDAIQATFSDFAEGFLIEECKLSWSPQKARLGETGEQMTYPAFELDMGHSGYASMVRRSGPTQVSESQREFIDLAFRMTLMTVAGAGGVGSLVIDAPESSLDAVFVTRAADVLTRFATGESDNRLMVTSNLIEGDLIPELLRRAEISSPNDDRIVDLLKIAEPTAATRQLGSEYRRVRKNLFQRASGKGS